MKKTITVYKTQEAAKTQDKSQLVPKKLKMVNGVLVSLRGNPFIQKNEWFSIAYKTTTKKEFKCNHAKCNNVKHLSTYFTAEDGNEYASLRSACHGHYYNTLPYDEYLEENLRILRFIQSGDEGKLLRDMYNHKFLNLESQLILDPLTGKRSRQSSFDLHHATYANGKSQGKNKKQEPSQLLGRTRLIKSNETLKEFLGIVTLSQTTHKFIHKQYSSMSA